MTRQSLDGEEEQAERQGQHAQADEWVAPQTGGADEGCGGEAVTDERHAPARTQPFA